MNDVPRVRLEQQHEQRDEGALGNSALGVLHDAEERHQQICMEAAVLVWQGGDDGTQRLRRGGGGLWLDVDLPTTAFTQQDGVQRAQRLLVRGGRQDARGREDMRHKQGGEKGNPTVRDYERAVFLVAGRESAEGARCRERLAIVL